MGLGFEPPGLVRPLLARRKLAAWLESADAACWLLLGGPGSGKTCSLELLVGSLGKPAVWLTCEGGFGEWVGLPADAEPNTVVEALAETMTSRYPDGVSVVWDAVERVFDQPAAVALLERWIKQAPPACKTLLSSRFPLPFPVSRQVIAGRIKRLGPAELWLSAEEVDDWLVAGPRHREIEDGLCGWPLGIVSLRQLAGQPDPDALLLGLVREEWLAHLPEQWRGWVQALLPLPALSTASIAQVLPETDPLAVFESLSLWGLLVGPGPVRPWHPLVRRHFKGFNRPLDERLLAWLGEQEPETAIACYQDRGDVAPAVRLMRRRGIHLLGEGIGPWLARFPAEERQRSLDLAAMDAAYLCARGELNEALARLRDALDRLRPASSPMAVFAALLELLHGYWIKQDFAAFEEIEVEAETLAPEADFADRIRYWNLKAIIRFDSGDEEEAERLTRQILEAPHFGQGAIAFIQQMAALNLGVREDARGRPEAALRQFARALSLAEQYPHRQEVRFGARLYLTACLLNLGRLEQGADSLRELEAASFRGDDHHRRAIFQSLLGHCHLSLGAYPRAEACFEDALELLTACGLEAGQEAASVLNRLAVLHRRRGELSLAANRHAQAIALARPWPHLALGFLLEQTVTQVLAQEAALVRATLQQVSDQLIVHPAPHLQAGAELIGAIAAWRSGDRSAAEAAISQALEFVFAGGYFHLAIAYPELSPDLWMLLGETGRGELLAEIESRFPEVAARVRSKRDEPAHLPAARPELEIRCFGTLEVFVGGRRIETWPRKRAKALLAFLVTAPKGLGREELFERLFPDLDAADPETRLNLLTSSLRKLLEPDLAPRQKSRYLQIVDKRLRLKTSGVRVDYAEFEEAHRIGMKAMEAGRPDEAVEAFRRASELYTGDLFCEPGLMEGFDLDRHRCRLRACRMLELSADRAFEVGRYDAARALSERLLEVEPTHEGAHRQLMRIYQLFGQEDLLRRQYQLCERLLRQTLDLGPSAETRRFSAESRLS